MIHRGADGFRKAVVIQGCRDRLLLVNNVVMAQRIQVIGANAGFHVWRNHMEHVGSEAAGYTHFGNFVGRFNCDWHSILSFFSVT